MPSDEDSPQSAPLAVGTLAPDFELRDQNNQWVSLADYRGRKNVLIVFFPLAFTGICTGELSYLRDNLPTFEDADIEIVAISVSPSPSHKIWSAEQGYLFPLLSDFWPHGEVTQKYGVFNSAKGYPNRGTFAIDKNGVIRFAEMNGPGEMRDDAVWQRVRDTLA